MNPKYMMATKATHKLGDLSREDEDYCYITKQTDKGYVGQWVEGMGFVNVTFPFDTTRELTHEEQEFVETNRAYIL